MRELKKQELLHGGYRLAENRDFSKLSRISVRMLRHYDEIGLLLPVYLDQFTDSRY